MNQPHRIQTTLAALKAQGRTALIPYITAGFPFADITPDLMHAMVRGGADVIELGVPFSDPSADGPVIQRSGDRALALGIGMAQVLEMVRAFRATDTRTRLVWLTWRKASSIASPELVSSSIVVHSSGYCLYSATLAVLPRVSIGSRRNCEGSPAL